MFYMNKAWLLAGAASVAPFGAAAAQDTTAAAPAATEAPAASAAAEGINDIIVTAQRRAQSVQDTPLAITAVSGEGLRERQVTRLEDLNNAVPNVNINAAQGNARITIRGIGTSAVQPGGESVVAYHIDGVYVSRPTSTLNSFFDVERLEVVRGPQGTLYGRNATGGAINVITRNPTDQFSGFGEVTLGNYRTINTEGAISGPLADGISARIAFQTQNRGGFGKQFFPTGAPLALPGSVIAPVTLTNSSDFSEDLDDLDTRAVRGKLKFEFGDVTAVLSAEYFHQDDHSSIYKLVRPGDSGLPLVDTLVGGILADDSYRDSSTNYLQANRKRDYAFSAMINWAASPGFTLTSVTGYRNTEYSKSWNQSGTQLSTLQYRDAEKGHQISEELRASGAYGRFNYVIGGFLFHEKQEVRAIDPIHNYQFGFPLGSSFLSQGYGTSLGLITDVKALFGQLSYEITDQIGIDAGLRYNWERKKKPFENFGYALCTPFDPNLVAWNTEGACDLNVIIGPRQVTSKSTKPKVTLRYKPNNDFLFYATYGEAFRSGGFNFGSGVDGPPFLPEELTAYEIGFKADLLDRRLQVNLAAFHYDYSNLQVSRLTDEGTGILTESAGKARVRGLEATIVALPVQNLRLNVDVGLLDAKYVRFSSVNTALVDCASGPLYCSALFSPGIDPVKNALAGVLQDLKGKNLIQAPEYNINAGAEYTFETNVGDFTLRGQGVFVDDIHFTPFNTRALTQKGYALFDAFLRYEHPNGHLYGSLFVKNIADKLYLTVAAPNGQITGAFVNGIAGPPRTFGGTVGFKF